MTKEVWEKIVKEEDENGDGSINFFEFSEILNKLLKN
jgi:hypothetical protein